MADFPVFAKKLYLSSPTMHGDEQKYVQEAFDTNWVAPLGENVDALEKAVAKYVGVYDGAALVSGTAALHLAVKLAGVQTGDVVFCSDLTFAATVNPVCYEGGTPVFIDSERDSWNMDPEVLKQAFVKYDGGRLPRPKAVIVVDLYGSPARLDAIRAVCDAYDTVLIEDAAESLGAFFKEQATGSFGRWNAVSFNGNKIITTSGGGMFLSDDMAAVRKVRFWATQAREPLPYYEHHEIGYNDRMSNIVAGIGRGQMLHLDEHVCRKRAIYERYRRGFMGLPVGMNPYWSDSRPNFWLSCLLLDTKVQVSPEDIRQKLLMHNIEARPIWKPMHLQPVFAGKDFLASRECVSEDVFRRGLCLPSDIKMTPAQQDVVIGIIKDIL